ncbi:hypothetical protein VTI74DRAFT_7244 [Chaetomium olivicolor]
MLLPSLLALAQWAGIVMPTLYAGITLQYSLTFSVLVSPLLSPTPNSKLLARQWLRIYQQGPYWVPPLIHTGSIANLYLAYHSHSPQEAAPHPSFLLYLTAAALTFSILPITFCYMEPGINGACKWKVAGLLRDEGFSMPEGGAGLVRAGVARHSASEEAKRWADGSDMKDLVGCWVRRNHGRWVIGVGAGVVSFWGLRCSLPADA